ncbi:hypothetical protein M5689_020864 [Euphorbia peplus]|nr:hypothetical protein M5689_020864 [Euphorbia peplus]
MSEPDQNMKALKTETSSFSSSLAKNDDNQKQKQIDIIQTLSDQSSNNKNVNLGLSLGGPYGSTSGTTPPAKAQNDLVDAGQRPSSPSKYAARNPGSCHVISNITTDNLCFQTEAGGHEVLPQMRLLVRPQFFPIRRRRPARSNSFMQSARAIAQRKLQQLIASTLNARPIDLSLVDSSSHGGPTAEMNMFQDMCVPSTDWNKRPVHAGIKFQSTLASPSYAELIAAGTEIKNPLVSNSVEVSGIMLHNGPAPILKGTVKLIQNTSGSDSNVEFGGTNFQNKVAGLDSNGESVEFVGTKFENAPIDDPSSNGSLTEYVGTMEPNDASKVENEGGGSGSNEITLEEIVAVAEENQEVKKVKLSNEGYGDYERRVLKKIPSVMNRGDYPNGV